MASMVAGVTIGSAKKTKITMARVNLKDEGLRVERYIDGLVMIYDDIYNKVLQGKAVVSISWGFTADYPDDQKYIEAARAAFEYLIKALLDNYNVLTVVSAGQANSDRYDDVSVEESNFYHNSLRFPAYRSVSCTIRKRNRPPDRSGCGRQRRQLLPRREMVRLGQSLWTWG